MKAGEYVGKDGKQYAVEKPFIRATAARREGDGVLYGSSTIVHITQDHPDWPAAKAALDALIAEQDAEWVELNGYWRISTDGIKVQRRDWCEDGDPWVDTTEAPELVKLYRTGLDHGLDVAHAENEALREQVRALVEEINDFRWPFWRACDECCNWNANERIHALAAKVQSLDH